MQYMFYSQKKKLSLLRGKKREREMILDKATMLLESNGDPSYKRLPRSFFLLPKASATSSSWDLVAAFHRFPINLPILPLGPFFGFVFPQKDLYRTWGRLWNLQRKMDYGFRRKKKEGSVKPNISQLEGCWPQVTTSNITRRSCVHLWALSSLKHLEISC